MEDINDKNILWGVASLDDYDTAAKYKRLGRPIKKALRLQRPGEHVSSVEIPISLLTDQVYLGDFGLTTSINIQGMEEWQPPMPYCAPELRHNFKPSFASDMWSYVCIFSKLYFGSIMFPYGLTTMFDTLGPMPKQWKGLREASIEAWYDQNRKVDFQAKIQTLFNYLASDAGEIERSHVISILKKGFRYLPEERMTATQLLQDPSFESLIKMCS